CKIEGFAKNPIFAVHTSLMKFIPVVLASINPELYEQAKDHLLDMNYADYFYLTGYPEYSGYRIEHDPTITAYCYLTTSEPAPEDSTGGGVPNWGALLIIFAIIVIIAVVAVVIIKTRS
ncbi:MAG TPA: hypothetical protein VLM82_02200, partial [Acidobacteriota bacterium]|nr:hypothetical protein [Acidobacteriota bacterium]